MPLFSSLPLTLSLSLPLLSVRPIRASVVFDPPTPFPRSRFAPNRTATRFRELMRQNFKAWRFDLQLAAGTGEI